MGKSASRFFFGAFSQKNPLSSFLIFFAFVAAQCIFWNQFSLSNYPGDFGDSRTSMLWMEHWRNSILSLNTPWDIPNFYPVTNTMSGSEAYLLQGLTHTVLRVMGLSIYSAFPLSILILNLIGNLSGLAIAKILKFNFIQTFMVATLYGTLVVFWLSRNHVQIMLASWLGWIVYFAIRAWRSGSKKDYFFLFLTAFLILLSYGYLMIFLVYTCFIFVVLSIFFKLKFTMFIRKFKTDFVNILVAFVFASPLFLLFVRIYLWKDSFRGKHTPTEVLAYSPRFIDIIDVPADSNWLLQHFDQLRIVFGVLNALPSKTWEGGSVLSLSVALLSLLICTSILTRSISSGLTNVTYEYRFVSCIAISLFVALLIVVKIGGSINIWVFSFFQVPFFSSIRVLSRYVEIVSLIFPFLLAWFLNFKFRQNTPIFRNFIMLIVTFLVMLEQISIPYGTFNKKEVFASGGTLGNLSNKCDSFFYLPALETYRKPAWAIPVDAFSIAIETNVPTVNGTSTFIPPGYPVNLVNPTSKNEVLPALDEWIKINSLTRVCLVESFSDSKTSRQIFNFKVLDY